MKLLFLVAIIIILTIFFLKNLIYRRKKENYLKAGKKWDGIVKELRRRK